MKTGAWLAGQVVPPLDRFFSASALKYEGSIAGIIGKTLPMFAIVLIVSWKILAEVYERKRER
jgi:hypothetical protein